MAGVVESVSTFNSFLRTILALVVLGGASVGGWFGYTTYFAAKLEAQKKDEQIAKLDKEIKGLNKQIERLDLALRLLKVDHRLARLTVLDQGTDENGELFTRIEFAELDERGVELERAKTFKLHGDRVYVDSLVIKFDDQYVEQADLERGTSLCMFQRIFGEQQRPAEGYPLDEVGARPAIYGRGKQPSEFESKIWADFWEIANDPQRAQALGIRAIHGEAPSIRVRKDKSYKLELRSSGGLTIRPDDTPRPGTPAT